MIKISRDTNMTSFDIHATIKEIKKLENSFIDNIYQADNIIGFKIRATEGIFILLLEPSKRIHLTQASFDWQATNFIKMIRKHLRGRKLLKINQHEFDRIVEFELSDNYKVILELLTRGNFIVSRDNKVLFALKHVHMRDRAIFPGAELKYPPGSPKNPLELTHEEFKSIIMSSRTLLHGLSKLGFGKKYSYEICHRCEISEPEKIRPEDLSSSDMMKLYLCTKKLFEEEIQPRVYLLDNKPLVFSPIMLYCLEEIPEIEIKTFNSFNEALDFYFSQLQAEIPKEKTLDILQREKEKLMKRIEYQRQHIAELNEKSKELREKGNLIYEKMDLLNSILATIKHAKIQLGLSWDEIIKRIEEGKKKEIEEAQRIKSVFRDGRIIVTLNEDLDVELDIKKSLHEIAQEYFEKAKKLESKIKKAEEELERSINEMDNLEKEIKRKIEQEKIIIKFPPRKWYHSFYWFISTDNLLVVAGRDAQSNEKLVKKYMEKNDLFLHAEIHGGAVVIIKNKNSTPIPNKSLLEAAIFAASYSKAWQKGLNSIDVFWTSPENVSTSPPSGQFLPTGAFIIHQKNYLKNVPLRLAIGIVIERKNNEAVVYPISGPPEAIKLKTKYYIIIAPGDKKKSEIAKMIISQIKKKFGKDLFVIKALRSIKIEKIIDLIPGPSRIVEENENE